MILGAVLQMIDHLQGGAQRVVGGPQRRRLAVHVEHEASDRRGGIATVVHELGPVCIALLGDVATEGFQKVERVLVGEVARLQDSAQRHAFCAVSTLAAQRCFHPRQLIELLRGSGAGMIGHIIGSAHEAIEGQNWRACLAADEPRRHREVFVLMTLA